MAITQEKRLKKEWSKLNHLLSDSSPFFFAGGCLGMFPGGAPFSQLSSGVKDAMVIVTV